MIFEQKVAKDAKNSRCFCFASLAIFCSSLLVLSIPDLPESRNSV